MREEAIKQDIENRFSASSVTVPRRQRIIISLPKDSLFSFIAFMKEEGFLHLSSIICVDWIEEDEFELVYHLTSFEEGIHAMVKTRISRTEGTYQSMIPLFEHAQTYEREIHEMFGVDFIGNQRLTPLLLTDWKEIPPMRKDFNTREYSERMFEHE
ncbi:MAG: NADH-quinone oxidoreductase subunit C [Candidatus Bipolaricaulota bacterium]|nr:NADH-quinone oxidoreductase subunit C [Candidatus Bipolaricaulota bacterium]